MHLNQSPVPGSPGDPASHLQFQISLLRLMSHKTMGKKDDSKVGSILKKTGRILKKPFKF